MEPVDSRGFVPLVFVPVVFQFLTSFRHGPDAAEVADQLQFTVEPGRSEGEGEGSWETVPPRETAAENGGFKGFGPTVKATAEGLPEGGEFGGHGGYTGE